MRANTPRAQDGEPFMLTNLKSSDGVADIVTFSSARAGWEE